MKTLYWDSGDPLDVWGNPNLYWGNPSYRLEPGDPGYVVWFPPGYQPPPPKPKPKPKRRRPIPLPQHTTTTNEPTLHTMENHFPFNVIPKVGGGNTTRVVPQEDMLTPELVALTKTALTARGITLSDEQITACGEELSKTMIGGLAIARVIRRAFGFFTYEASCGGTHADPDFSPTPANMNAGVRARLAPGGQALFESLLHFFRVAVLGAKAPTVTRVYDGTSREIDRITLGGPFRLTGPRDFGPQPNPADTALGVFLVRTGGTPVRIGVFSDWSPSEIFGAYPAAISGTGNVQLSVVTRYPGNADPSTFIYSPTLPIVP